MTARPATFRRSARHVAARPSHPYLSARRMLAVGFLMLLVLVLGLGGWTSLATISGAVIAPGQVVVAQSRQVVQHPDGGVVAEILVREGDQVAAGQVVLRLDGTLLRPELAIVEGQQNEILARKGRLEAERANAPMIRFSEEIRAAALGDPAAAEQMAGQERLFDARRETLEKSLDQIDRRLQQTRAQIDGIVAQSDAVQHQTVLISRELSDQRSLLDKGLTQSGRVLGLEREAAGLAGQIGALASSRAQAAARINELELERLWMVSQRREDAEAELRDIGYRELELAERRRSLAGQIELLDLRAPASGIVYAMSVTTPRSVIRAAEPVLYVVPKDRPLLIEARVSPMSIDHIHPGQDVLVRFPGVAGRQSAEISGRVSLVSADAIADEATKSAYYRVEVSLDEAVIEHLDSALIPGIPAEVLLRTGDRTPLEYLLQPFTAYFGRAFREK